MLAADPADLFPAILAEPDVDLHRLVYADAIEDTDPERAEFIRVQCKMAELESDPEHAIWIKIGGAFREAKYQPLKQRERE